MSNLSWKLFKYFVLGYSKFRLIFGLLSILVISVILGLITLSREVFPTTLEIKHINNKTQAVITKREISSFFKKRITIVENVKEATIEKIPFDDNVLSLRDIKGKRYSVTSHNVPSDTEARQLLLKRINTSIKSNVNFKFRIIDKADIIWASIGVAIPSMILYFWISYDIKKRKEPPKRILNHETPNRKQEENDEDNQTADLENYPVSEAELERQALESQDPVEEPKKSNEEKYKNINDSIIK